MNGAITQEGMNVLQSFGELLCITSELKVKFKQIQCGYSHAVLVDEEDQVYSFGANIYG
jgi:alpha-tubulin suppressor-like RCC1 family protein